jgi:hypothetical protein
VSEEPRGLLTFDEAAEKIGWTGKGRGRRLKRACFARERETKRRIITRMGSERMPAYKVTLGALRKAFPELFGRSKVDALQANFRNYLAAIDERIAEKTAAHVTEHVEPRLQELWERDEAIAERVDALAERVVALSRAK